MASETITKNDLTAILNEVLPSDHYIQSWEYVGDVYWWSNTWTVPDDGFIEVYAEPSASNWYWRISDSKAPDTGWSHRLAGANTSTVSQEFFVKKGAVLGTNSMNGIGTAHVYYYKFVLKDSIIAERLDSVHAEIVTANISMAYGSNVTVTAPTVSGYKFLCWAQVATNGWVGSVYPSSLLQQSSPMWNATQGNSGTGQIDCLALYVPVH